MKMGQDRRTRVMREIWHEGRNASLAYRAALARLVRPGMRVLHAGCGWDKNDVTRPYKDRCEVVGVDVDPRVQSRFHSEFHLASLSALPFEDEHFDLVCCEYVLEHLEDPGSALCELSRVLNPNGCLLALTPNLHSYKSLGSILTPFPVHLWLGHIRYGRDCDADMYPTHYRCNTRGRLRALAGASGLEISSLELITNGPTWFETFPVLFDLFHLAHRAIERWGFMSGLRCAMLVELRRKERSGAFIRARIRQRMRDGEAMPDALAPPRAAVTGSARQERG